ncbi:MAG: sigma-70 family RNA polymerase sigma factor [Phycisphaerales bacterium]|nr:MAG: sigma-70 family RNA polymerase sigma factor [Phycisphaerales bacterium]
MYTETATRSTLLEDVARGEPAAWREFNRRYGELIRRIASRRGLQPADGDEVVQMVLVKLSTTMPGFTYDRAKGRFRGYLKAAVVHAICDLRQKRDPSWVLQMESGASRLAGPVDDEQVWEKEWRMHHLGLAWPVVRVEFSDRDQRAFESYVFQGRSAADTAAELGMSVDQVYQARTRILKKLKVQIARQIAEEG